jgi:hypothetical protein
MSRRFLGARTAAPLPVTISWENLSMRIILMAFCAASLYAADLTGRWVGPGSTADNGQEFVLAIKQAPDGTLTG